MRGAHPLLGLLLGVLLPVVGFALALIPAGIVVWLGIGGVGESTEQWPGVLLCGAMLACLIVVGGGVISGAYVATRMGSAYLGVMSALLSSVLPVLIGLAMSSRKTGLSGFVVLAIPVLLLGLAGVGFASRPGSRLSSVGQGLRALGTREPRSVDVRRTLGLLDRLTTPPSKRGDD
jgi:hypothetical protein